MEAECNKEVQPKLEPIDVILGNNISLHVVQFYGTTGMT